MLRALLLTTLACQTVALFKPNTAPKPVVAGRGGRVVPTRGAPAPVPEAPPELVQQTVDVGITAMRLGTCALMVHHGFDKIQNVDGFSANVVAKFFGFLPGPPQFWTLSAAATQIAGAGLLSIGLFSRPVAASMSVTMIVRQLASIRRPLRR